MYTPLLPSSFPIQKKVTLPWLEWRYHVVWFADHNLTGLNWNCKRLAPAHSETSRPVWHSWTFYRLAKKGGVDVCGRSREAARALKLRTLLSFPSAFRPTSLQCSWIIIGLHATKLVIYKHDGKLWFIYLSFGVAKARAIVVMVWSIIV